jgi:hypothetical protein
MFIFLQKWWLLPWRDKLLLIEATLWLMVAAVAIALLPFRHIGRLASLQFSRQAPHQQARLRERRRIAGRSGLRTDSPACRVLQQGLAAQFARRRPLGALLRAAPDTRRGLSAHVWVRDGDADVVGCEIASRFATLTTFPQQGGVGAQPKSLTDALNQNAN